MIDRQITVAEALIGPQYEPAGPVEITVQAGVITGVRKLSERPEGRRLLALPALADGHNHARPLSPTSFGAGMKPLETWLPCLAGIPAVDPYLAMAAALGRSLRGGCLGAMVHLIRPMGLTPLLQEAQVIARAASDVGMRIGLAIAMRDRNPLVYGDHSAIAARLGRRFDIDKIWRTESLSAEEQVRRVGDVAEEIRDQTHVDVQFGPAGVQWCSNRLIEMIARASADTGRRVHMHLLETREQRLWADRTYPGGIIEHLSSIGLLSPRLTVAHCVWARPEELAMLAAHGVRIAVNPSSNLHLRSGIADVAGMKAAGIRFGIGLDGTALDEDDDALREMRLFRLLNAGIGFDEKVTAVDALTAACRTGRDIVCMQEGGCVEAGMPADLMLLDLDALDRDQILDVDPRHYLFGRASQQHIVEVMRGGGTILRDGKVLGIDLDAIEDALRCEYRSAIGSTAHNREAFAALEPLIADYYRGCC
jgi:cytosine/adenosine deaminase-related metal-dependent hydrolase